MSTNAFSWDGVGTLVTGASGFVGGWLASELASRGARVVALVRDADPVGTGVHPELWERAIVVRGDITDLPVVRRALAEYGVTACFHLAAQASVEAALADPVGTLEANVRGTWMVLEACRLTTGIDRIVIAASDKAYGEPVSLPYEEDAHPLLGTYPYDASKAAADVISRSYARTFDMPVAVTRMANIYGGGDLDVRRIIPGTIAAILAGRRPIIRSDGSPQRDYLYVKDAVAGYITLAEQLDRADVRARAFNFGSGVPVSVLDLVRMILKVAESDLEPDVRGTAANELSRQYLSVERARTVLGWEPATSLEDGLAETLAWYREHPAQARSWKGATS
jgi:CDP-glucose 4,6-dehydratase